MSYREKSVLGTTIITALVMFWYFFEAYSIYLTGGARAGSLTQLVLPLIVLVVVLEVGFETINAIFDRGDTRVDERDTQIGARGDKIGEYLVHSGLYAAIGYLVAQDAMSQLDGVTVFIAINLALLGVTLAELVAGCCKLFWYRRGY